MLYLDAVVDRKTRLLTDILPYLFRVLPLRLGNPRHIKRLKVQTCLHSDSGMEKALLLQVPGHDISHNGRFLRRFLAISAEIAYNTCKAGSTSELPCLFWRPLCLMITPISAGSISVDSPIPLAPCSPPVRRVAGGRGNIHGRYPSRKMRRTIQFESHTELGAIYIMEHDPGVLEYWDQPTKLKLHYLGPSGRRVTNWHLLLRDPSFLHRRPLSSAG